MVSRSSAAAARSVGAVAGRGAVEGWSPRLPRIDHALASACVWRITDFRHKSAIRHTQVVPPLTDEDIGRSLLDYLRSATAGQFWSMPRRPPRRVKPEASSPFPHQRTR